jgi:Uma2 family endonuclease
MTTTLAEPLRVAEASVATADEILYEIIDGQRVELPPMSVYATWVASLLVNELAFFARMHPIGRPFPEMLFRLPLNGSRNRRPDVAFVTFERWPIDRPIPAKGNAWDVVPDLAVEVTSPNDFADEIMQKVIEYFQAGVRLVWIIYPQQRLVHVYESPVRIRGLAHTDELDGGSVLPGFRVPLANLFPQTDATS